MNETLYLLVRRTPNGMIFANRTPFGSLRDAARVAGLVLSDYLKLGEGAGMDLSEELASRPLGSICANKDSGFDFRVLTADFTADNVPITPGLRVLTTDMVWGSVGRAQFMRTAPLAPGGEHFGGWYSVELNGDGREKDFNGERLTTDGARFNKPDVSRGTSPSSEETR